MPHTKFEQFLERVFTATGISSQMELASALSINRSAITQARKKNAIPDRWILQLYREFGLNPDWLESGVGETFLARRGPEEEGDFRKVPKVKARLCAGGGSFDVTSDIEGYHSFNREWLSAKGGGAQMVLMDIFGNSMAPELKDGDTVLVNQAEKDILAGAIYAVGVDDTIMVKRIEKHPRKLVLLSDNAAYAPIYLTEEEMDNVRIIGKVIWVCREYR